MQTGSVLMSYVVSLHASAAYIGICTYIDIR